MNLLDSLNEKMKDELDIKDKPEDEMDVETPEEDDSDTSSTKDGSKSRIRIETDSRMVGIIRNLDYDIKFKELADRMKEEVPGVTITRDKAKQIFNVVRDMIGF